MERYDARSSKTSVDEDIEMVAIYTTGSFAEAEIITDIFDEEDIAYIVRGMEERAFPGVGDHSQIRLLVEEGRGGEARGFIQQAIVDEAIPGEGNFLEPTRPKKKKNKKRP